MDLVIGVDAGGTTTRCLVADLGGRRRGRGRAGGVNQRSSGGSATTRLAEAVRAALGSDPPSRVRGGVLAIAGAGEAGQEVARRDAAAVWSEVGLGGRPVVVPDVLATYAAGAREPDGVVLVAGTGAIAAAVHDLGVVRRADGYGWLLGDVGSAVWLGREALTAVLAAMDGRGPATDLVDPMLDAVLATRPVGPGRRSAQEVVAAVYAVPPADLGLLAPVVTDLAAAGDTVAGDLVRRGVAGLLASFDTVRRPGVPGPCVLGGALLTTTGPVGDGVQRGLAERGVTDLRAAHDASAGAAWIALRQAAAPDDPAVHARLAQPG